MLARRGDGRMQREESDRLIRKGQAMTDVTNKTRLLVLKYKDSNAYIRLSADQVPEVQKLFDGDC